MRPFTKMSVRILNHVVFSFLINEWASFILSIYLLIYLFIYLFIFLQNLYNPL